MSKTLFGQMELSLIALDHGKLLRDSICWVKLGKVRLCKAW